MLILFLVVIMRYAVFKESIASKEGVGSISSTIINTFSPCLIISGILSKTITYSMAMVTENLVPVVLFFTMLIMLSRLFTRLMKLEPGGISCYRLMMIFPSLGFMGIPLVHSLYDKEAVVFVAFYIVGYNLLAYSCGVVLVMGAGAGGRRALSWKRVLSIGAAVYAVAILILAFHIQVPEVVGTFVNMVGNAAVSLSMVTVGVMMAQSGLKELIVDRRQLMLSFIFIPVIPTLCIPFMELLSTDSVSYGIFILLIAMPVGSMVMIVEKECGSTDGSILTKSVVLTSVLSVITIPVVTLLA